MITRVALLSLLLISGCTFHKVLPPIDCKDIPKIDPPMPTPVTLGAPEFYVVSNENKEAFADRIQKDSNGVFYATTPGGYTILAQNMQELRRYIRELQGVVLYYKNYDKSFNTDKVELDTSNSVRQ